MRARPVWLSVMLMVVTVAGGWVIRFVPLGLPYGVTKYGGSMLWALMIYWVVTTVGSTLGLVRGVVIAGVVATAVEFLKLYHTARLDAFRLTLPGVVLLGRFFSVRDIVAYWAAILVGAFVDRAIRRRAGDGATSGI